MIVSAHQPAYIPWLGYFHKIALSDIFIILDNVQFEKNSFINRNKIKTKDGAKFLTVPVKMKGHLTSTTSLTKIDNLSIKWQKKHLLTIEQFYAKSQYFIEYRSDFKIFYEKDWSYLIDLTDKMLTYFLDILGINTKIVKCSELKNTGRKEQLILNLCKQLGANTYISGIFGKDYLNKTLFTQHGINVYFQDYNHPVYPQLHGNFIPNLSIIDLLFNCGPHSGEILTSGNVNRSNLRKAIDKKNVF